MTCTQPGGPEPFREAAPFYHHRLPYPRAMLDDLRSRVGVTGSGRLLDLGCGDGRVSVPLAPSFAEVWAVDVEAAMLEEGRKRAKKAGATNVRWILSRAKDVEIPAASVDLITAGESFHRMDQTVVAEQAMNWLRTGWR